MTQLKKLLDNTPKQVYNICKKDGEGFDLSSIRGRTRLTTTLYSFYKVVRDTYDNNSGLFPNPPIFAGGFFRDLLWENDWPSDLDLFFNSHGMTKEEAEDNLCLFLSKLGLKYEELDNENYAGLGSMRVFNVYSDRPEVVRCHLQAILKDLGPPSDDPLYVTEDFHYNHGRAALPVVGTPQIHYHGHAVAGHVHKIHVAYREGGMKKCTDKFYGRREFKQVAFTSQHATKPKSPVKMPTTNPCSEIKMDQPIFWDEVFLQQNGDRLDNANEMMNRVVQARALRAQQRNEFVNQFDPLRNNRRPLP